MSSANSYRVIDLRTGDAQDYTSARDVTNFFWGRMDMDKFAIFKNRKRFLPKEYEVDKFTRELSRA